MKKICFDIETGIYPTHVGGMEVFNYYLIKELSKKVDVSYVSTERYNHNCGNWIKTISIRPTKYINPIKLGIHCIIHKPNIVVISFSEASWKMWNLYRIVLTNLNIPYIIVIHHGKTPANDHIIQYEKFFKSARHIIAVSDDIKRNYDSLYNIDCIVIPPLIPFTKSDLSKFAAREKYGIPQDANVIGMIGTIKEMKNPKTIIEAVSQMTKYELDSINPFIVFAGIGPDIENLKNLAKKLKIDNRIKFLGFIPKEQVSEIMNLIDYYLIASDYEGTSVSLLEAMFNSKPIIASQVKGIIDTVTLNEANLFEVRNSDSLKQSLLSLIDNPQRVETIRQNAFNKFMTQYNYNDMLNKYINLL